MGRIITKNLFFSVKWATYKLNYAFLLFWSIFGEIHRELLFLVKKVTISEMRTNTQKFVFLNIFQMGKVLRKIWICFKQNIYDFTSKRGQVLTKTVFLPKLSPLQLNYAFLVFWSILGEIHRELLFFVKKVTISARSTEILRKFVFLKSLKRGKSWRKFGFF